MGSPLDPMVNALTGLALTIGGAALATVSIVSFLRWLGLHWSWALPGVALGPALWWLDPGAAGFAAVTALSASVTGARWHQEDLRIGAERAEAARSRRTPWDAGSRPVRAARAPRGAPRALDHPRGLDRRPRRARPGGAHPGRIHERPAHAGRRGDRVGQDRHPGLDRCTAARGRSWRGGHRSQGRSAAARRARARCQEGAADVSGVVAGGAGGLQPVRARHRHRAGRQGAGRRDLHRAALPTPGAALPRPRRPRLARAGLPVSVATLADSMDPVRLEAWARALPVEQAKATHTYLDALSPEQRRGLAGTRDRLAILAESDVADFLWRSEPTRHNIDLLAAVRRRDVVLFRLDADRRPRLAGMLAAAIVQDLLTIAAELQHEQVATLVLIDSTGSPAGDVSRTALR